MPQGVEVQVLSWAQRKPALCRFSAVQEAKCGTLCLRAFVPTADMFSFPFLEMKTVEVG